MKTILVPTDFSHCAENAVNYAIELALLEKSKIILYHSLEPDYASFLYTLMVTASGTFREQAEEQMTQLAAKIKMSGSTDYECLVKDEDFLPGFLDTAGEKKADLIVMGTSGATGFKKFLFGSNAAKIVEKAHCPVLIVPDKVRFKGIHHITFASDYQRSDISALESTVSLAKNTQAQINILHIYEDGKDRTSAEDEGLPSFMEKVNAQLPSQSFTYQVIKGKDFLHELDQHLESDQTDLLVLSTEHRALLEQIGDKSSSKELAYHSKTPLLVFHHAKAPYLI